MAIVGCIMQRGPPMLEGLGCHDLKRYLCKAGQVRAKANLQGKTTWPWARGSYLQSYICGWFQGPFLKNESGLSQISVGTSRAVRPMPSNSFRQLLCPALHRFSKAQVPADSDACCNRSAKRASFSSCTVNCCLAWARADQKIIQNPG